MLDSLLETPAHEVGIDLKRPVDGEGKDKGDVETVEAGRAKTRGHGAVVRGGFGGCAPELTTIVALPHNFALLTIQLEDHEAGTDSDDDQNDWPDEEAKTHEHVRVVSHTDGGQHTNRHDTHADTAIDLVFRIVEEEELTFLEEENGACQVVGSNKDVPHHSTVAQREDEQTIVAPHVC